MSKKVITYDGTTALRDDCAYIKEEYYIIGDSKVKNSGQCYPITFPNGDVKRYRINSGSITWDYEKEEYVLINSSLVNGATIDGEGYFTRNKYKNVQLRSFPFYKGVSEARRTTVWCLDEDTAILLGATLSPVDGFWYLNSDDKQLRNHSNWQGKESYNDFTSGAYSLGEVDVHHEVEEYYNSLDIKVPEIYNEMYKFFNNYSFGVEVETSSGRLQEKDLWQCGLIPLKDGSIDNHEYVSVPLRGEKGLYNLVESMKLLQKTCKVNLKCSLHYHIGNVIEQQKNPKLFLVTLYVLYYLIQKEIWQMIPPYKKSLDYIKTKRDFKDHCQDLNSLMLLDYNIYNQDGTINQIELDTAFDVLFTFWNDGEKPNSKYNANTRRHVKEGRPKWEVNSRYHNLNMFNAFFSNSNTLEFRAHGGTTNVDKSLSWLLICVGILRYAEKYSYEILTENVKPSLNKIIEEFKINFGKENINPDYATYVSEYLHSYVKERQQNFVQLYLNRDIYGSEFQADSDYTHKLYKTNLYEWGEK